MRATAGLFRRPFGQAWGLLDAGVGYDPGDPPAAFANIERSAWTISRARSSAGGTGTSARRFGVRIWIEAASRKRGHSSVARYLRPRASTSWRSRTKRDISHRVMSDPALPQSPTWVPGARKTPRSRPAGGRGGLEMRQYVSFVASISLRLTDQVRRCRDSRLIIQLLNLGHSARIASRPISVATNGPCKGLR